MVRTLEASTTLGLRRLLTTWHWWSCLVLCLSRLVGPLVATHPPPHTHASFLMLVAREHEFNDYCGAVAPAPANPEQLTGHYLQHGTDPMHVLVSNLTTDPVRRHATSAQRWSCFGGGVAAVATVALDECRLAHQVAAAVVWWCRFVRCGMEVCACVCASQGLGVATAVDAAPARPQTSQRAT